eukprot:6188623-Pleurochrysis_carterae.AAC.1
MKREAEKALSERKQRGRRAERQGGRGGGRGLTWITGKAESGRAGLDALPRLWWLCRYQTLWPRKSRLQRDFQAHAAT